MIAAAVALIVAGLVIGLFFPYGFILSGVGLFLLIFVLVGFRRRSVEGRT